MAHLLKINSYFLIVLAPSTYWYFPSTVLSIVNLYVPPTYLADVSMVSFFALVMAPAPGLRSSSFITRPSMVVGMGILRVYNTVGARSTLEVGNSLSNAFLKAGPDTINGI